MSIFNSSVQIELMILGNYALLLVCEEIVDHYRKRRKGFKKRSKVQQTYVVWPEKVKGDNDARERRGDRRDKM